MARKTFFLAKAHCMRENRGCKPLLLTIILIVLGAINAGCSGRPTEEHALHLAPLADMPAEVQTAPVVVREAYQFAAANPEIMGQIPCYCGCGDIGHTSNYACYISNVDAAGQMAFDLHALDCSICVDITQDTMRLLKAGGTTPEIKSTIDETYSKYGPSNMP